MKQFSIMGRRFGTDKVSEIAQCDSNPAEIVAAAANQRLFIGVANGRRIFVDKFENVHFVDNAREAVE